MNFKTAILTERGAVMAVNVTVLNADYEPLHSVSLQHAVRMLVRGVAEVHESADEFYGTFIRPISVRLVKYLVTTWRYQRLPKWSKSGVLRRDNYVCAFCKGKANTIDHITPRSQGGKNTWTNTISACLKCNNKKADRTPKQANMPLLFEAKVPSWTDLYKS
jgi:5-methylcytosine-specific restriction endonuclease McrA